MEVPVNPDPVKWNDAVAASPYASILQSFEWGQVKRGTWTPLYVRFTDAGRSIGQALILKRRLPGTPFSILYAPRGPILQDWTSKALHAVAAQIRELAGQHRALAFRCDPEIPESNVDAVHALRSAGFSRSSENIQPRGTILLDLRPDAETMMAGYHHKTRYNIRLAFKKGVVVEEKNSPEGVDLFYDLFRTTAARDGFMILSKSYFHHLHRTLGEKNLCTIFVATYQHRPLAAIVQTVFDGRMTYLYGASSNEHRNLMPNHAVHWRAIEWAKQRGVTSYDLWGIPAHPHEGHPLWGVYRFKKGFSETETHWIGTYELVFRPVMYRTLMASAGAAKSVIRFLKTGKWKGSLGE